MVGSQLQGQVSLHEMTPNPSIEQTHNGVAADALKRAAELVR